MKVTLISILLCAALSSFAQWNPNGATTGNIYYSGGNVGIGINNPISGLTINSIENQTILGGNSTSALRIMNGYADAFGRRSELQFSLSQSSNELLAVIAGEYASWNTGVGGDLVFGTKQVNMGSILERMRIKSDGNVGIGTSAPVFKLHVLAPGASAATLSSGAAVVVASATGATDPFGAIQMTNDPNYGANYFGARARSNSGNLAAVLSGDVLTGLYGRGYTGTGWSNGMAAIRFVAAQDFAAGLGTQMEFATTSNGGTSRSTRMVINHAGNVGIGTTSPAARFEVNGDANIGSNIGTVDGYGVKLSFLGNSLNGDPLWISRYNNGANYSEMRLNIGDDFGQAQDMFVVGTHHWNGGEWKPHFSVHASGNVGIGTTNPNQKLTVNGTIYGKEVKVDLSVPGPDYVFEPDYNLPSLTEIETYIKANKHLPEVPSAKEMETNGINLSEMNMLLLKKVEELTLHLIGQQKQMEAQQNEIELLKMKIK